MSGHQGRSHLALVRLVQRGRLGRLMLRGRDLGAKIRLLPLGLGRKQAELRHLGGRLLLIPGHLEQPASRVLGTLLVHLSVAISGHQRQSAIRGNRRS